MAGTNYFGQPYFGEYTPGNFVTNTKTQTTKSRIQKSVSTTQTTKSRIQKTFTTTQTTKSRIQATKTNTQTTKSRIQKVFTSTQTTKSRMVILGTTTQTTKSAIFPAGEKYSYAVQNTLPTDDSDLTLFNYTQYYDVYSADGIYFDNAGTGQYHIILFKFQGTNNTADISVQWKVKSGLASTTAPFHLEIYNYVTSQWETLNTNNTTAANTAVTITGSTVDPTDYYTTGNWVAVRGWQ